MHPSMADKGKRHGAVRPPHQFPEKVAVASEANPAALYKKVGCDFPKKWQ